MLEPRLLHLFVQLAEDRHFGRTAERLNIAQSTVSTQLRRLEDVIGAPLFARHKKSAVHLTEVGRIFLIEARETLDRLARAETVGRIAARGEAGPMTLGYIFSAVPSGLLPQLLMLVRQAMPLVQVAPRLAETPDQLAAIAGRRLDLGLGRPRPAYPDGVRARIVHREPLVLLLARDHPIARHAVVPASALHDAIFLLPQFNERFGLLEKLERLAAAGGFAMPALIRTSDFVTAASMAAAGYGVVLAPAALVRLGVDGLVARAIEGFDDGIETALFWHAAGSRVARRVAELAVALPGAAPTG